MKEFKVKVLRLWTPVAWLSRLVCRTVVKDIFNFDSELLMIVHYGVSELIRKPKMEGEERGAYLKILVMLGGAYSREAERGAFLRVGAYFRIYGKLVFPGRYVGI